MVQIISLEAHGICQLPIHLTPVLGTQSGWKGHRLVHSHVLVHSTWLCFESFHAPVHGYVLQVSMYRYINMVMFYSATYVYRYMVTFYRIPHVRLVCMVMFYKFPSTGTWLCLNFNRSCHGTLPVNGYMRQYYWSVKTYILYLHANYVISNGTGL